MDVINVIITYQQWTQAILPHQTQTQPQTTTAGFLEQL